MNKIIIYSNKTCPYCEQIKGELTSNDITFENRITSDNKSEWQDVVSLTGIPIVPTILYEGEYFAPGRDFKSPKHLIGIISNYKKSPFSIERRTSEQLKTLIHSINSAFSKITQTLMRIENKIK